MNVHVQYSNGLAFIVFLLAASLHCKKQKKGLLTSKSCSIMSVLWFSTLRCNIYFAIYMYMYFIFIDCFIVAFTTHRDQ